MKQFLILPVCLMLGSVFAQSDSTIVFESLKKHVEILASDSLQGRATGSEGEKMANEYIRSQFIDCKKCRFYRWKFDIPLEDDTLQSEMTGVYLHNGSDSTVLIGAHMDHLGLGNKYSLAPGKMEVHNGADDNASGVAILIELQKALSLQKSPYNILIVPYTAHEIGTFGSEYLSSHLPKKMKPIRLVVNFDMVGRMDSVQPVIWMNAFGIDSNFYSLPKSFELKTSTQNKLPILDTKHFLKDSIPCVTMTTGMHIDYHRPSDDTQYLNLQGMTELYFFVLNWLTLDPKKR